MEVLLEDIIEFGFTKDVKLTFFGYYVNLVSDFISEAQAVMGFIIMIRT